MRKPLTVQEFIYWVNDKVDEENIAFLTDVIYEWGEDYEETIEPIASHLNREYDKDTGLITSMDVYKFKDGYVGVVGVEHFWEEWPSDIGYTLDAHEVEPYETTNYRWK